MSFIQSPIRSIEILILRQFSSKYYKYFMFYFTQAWKDNRRNYFHVFNIVLDNMNHPSGLGLVSISYFVHWMDFNMKLFQLNYLQYAIKVKQCCKALKP